MNAAPSLLGALRAGLLCRRRYCGRGPLYTGVLGLAEEAALCGLDLEAEDSGDGPAGFVILIGGFVTCLGPVIHEILARPPWRRLLMIWPAACLIVCPWLLRPAKSLLIAMQLHHHAGEGRSGG